MVVLRAGLVTNGDVAEAQHDLANMVIRLFIRGGMRLSWRMMQNCDDWRSEARGECCVHAEKTRGDL